MPNAVTTDSGSTAPRGSKEDIDDSKVHKAGVETQLHMAGREESKNDPQLPSTGAK
jgi:hypothetical protein